ncbi:MAG: UvrB/UvrC motif-containing protein [Elusimicrobia bacterium]|nr:UvrB/UvrC motif-containing protein [Elusimicrobiota bacterium]
MLCSECQGREAQVFLKQIVNSQVTQRALCQDCAQKLNLPASATPDALLLEVLAGLGALLGGEPAREAPLEQCPACGLRWTQFQRSGRLGCADCYESFHGRLADLLRRVHGSDQHRGKLPKGSREAKERLHRGEELKRLQKQLKAAIDGERFEEAAALRDRIQKLQG